MSAAQKKRFEIEPVHSETRAKLSAALKGRPKTPEHIEAAIAPQRGVPKGPLSLERRLALAKFHRERAKTYRGRNHHSFGKKPPHIRKIVHNGTVYRSSYEVRFAQMLERQRVQFVYEPRTFDLGDTTYTPDFLLVDYELWCEVKGWMRDEAREKIRRFRERYPQENLTVVPKEFFIQKRDLLSGA